MVRELNIGILKREETSELIYVAARIWLSRISVYAFTFSITNMSPQVSGRFARNFHFPKGRSKFTKKSPGSVRMVTQIWKVAASERFQLSDRQMIA
jgi:hypothetical protein